jgi:hypothetical protein
MHTHPSAPANKDSTKPAERAETFAFLDSETALQEFVETWKSGRLPKSAWTHAAHVATAAYFAFDHALEATFALMKAGILHHNTSVGTPNTEDNGYHETLTRFWAAEIGEFVRCGHFSSRLGAVRATVAAYGQDRDRYRLFYSFDVLRDRRARRDWIAPDRNPAAESL